jgi:hypothetical protein
MAFKVYCDICEKEVKDKDFVFEATIAEVINGFDVLSKNLNPTKQMQKKMAQACRECYEKDIKPLLKI